MAEGGGRTEPGFEESSTYAVAATAALFVLVSLAAERGIHRLKKYLKRKNQKPLRKVLDKMTEELMLLGFISLLLTVLQSSVGKICVPSEFARHMLPCSNRDFASEAFSPSVSHVPKLGRRLLHYYAGNDTSDNGPRRHLMAEGAASDQCEAEGKVPFVSREVLHELHILIFVLAVTHVFYSFFTMCLGFARLHRWQRWEKETQVDGYDGKSDLERSYWKSLESNKPAPGRLSNHACHERPISIWIVCFFKQFVAPISREDYLAFRRRFINNHNLPESFNFWDYVIRSMEVDFKKIIGISWWLWLFVMVFLLLNVHGWNTYFWTAFIPAIIVLVIGTTQQHVTSTLALQAKRHAADVRAAESDPNILKVSSKVTEAPPPASSSDNVLWFDNPNLLLILLHFVIFQNSFELAFFFWLLTTFGWKSCVLGNHMLLIVRIIIGLLTQLLASYSTLPIYALVTQMGSQMKDTIFRKDVHEGLQAWKSKAQRKRLERSSGPSFEDDTKPSGNESVAEARTEESQPGHSIIQLATTSENGTPAESAVPNPHLAKRFQLMYGKINALEKIKSTTHVNPRCLISQSICKSMTRS